MTPVERVIIDSAHQHGVDPYLALATAQVESRLDPRAQGDIVNGEATSFGLFQLHRGGELGDLTPEQAYDPRTNADVALAVVSAVYHQHPSWTPGEIAAAAQRPAHPGVYAARVNAVYASMVGPSFTVLYRLLRFTHPQEFGADVRALQHRFGISPDSVYGPVTLAHVQTFQGDHGLVSDGIVGPKTAAALGWHWAG